MLFKQTARTDQPAGPVAGEPSSKGPLVSPSKVAPTAKVADPAAARDPAADSGKRLIVGQGIRLQGEITACDRLIVEGEVEAVLNETRMLEIRSSGRFAGSCEVEEAEVSGVYQGDLIVRSRLIVRTGGRVAGNIDYGEIELERGAQISGELSTGSARRRVASSAPATSAKAETAERQSATPGTDASRPPSSAEGEVAAPARGADAERDAA